MARSPSTRRTQNQAKARARRRETHELPRMLNTSRKRQPVPVSFRCRHCGRSPLPGPECVPVCPPKGEVPGNARRPSTPGATP